MSGRLRICVVASPSIRGRLDRRARSAFGTTLLALLLLGSGCAVGDAPASPGGGSDDLPAFTAEAYPVLAKDCAFPACHGAEHPGLQLYAIGRSRLGDPASLDAVQYAALTPAEASHDLAAVLTFVDPAHPERSELLERALPAAAGGRGHRGGVLFTGRDDPDYLQLLGWIETAVHP